jgi:hypothetical protein
MRKRVISFVFLVVAILSTGGALFSCEDPVEELKLDGCAPNMPGWPECRDDGDGPDASINKR